MSKYLAGKKMSYLIHSDKISFKKNIENYRLQYYRKCTPQNWFSCSTCIHHEVVGVFIKNVYLTVPGIYNEGAGLFITNVYLAVPGIHHERVGVGRARRLLHYQGCSGQQGSALHQCE